MILGHFGLALAARRLAPRGSLGTFTLAAQLVDLVWPLLLIAGVEHVVVAPGILPASPFDFTDYPWTHSLLAGVAWGVVLGAVVYAVRRDARYAVVAGALVVSHWVLDLMMHRPDLPLWPGGPREGLGAWRSVPLTLALELSFFVAGAWLYLGATRAIDRTGRYALAAWLVALGLLYAFALLGAPPPSGEAVGWSALGLWLFVPWAYWIDRHRAARAVAA